MAEFTPTDESTLKLDEQKTIAYFEESIGIVLHGDIELNKKVTRGDFLAMLADRTAFTYVTHADRKLWLEHNGYDVTRENMIADLPSKQAIKEQKAKSK